MTRRLNFIFLIVFFASILSLLVISAMFGGENVVNYRIVVLRTALAAIVILISPFSVLSLFLSIGASKRPQHLGDDPKSTNMLLYFLIWREVREEIEEKARNK